MQNKLWIIFLLIITSCFLTVASAQTTQENPIFFDPFWGPSLLNWDVSSGPQISFDANIGHCDHKEGCVKGAIRFEASGSDQSMLLKEAFPVEAGKSYFYFAWIKTKDAQGTLGLNVIWLDAHGQRFGQPSSITVENVNGSAGWREVPVIKDGVVAPSGATAAQLEITGRISSGSLWLDDVYFSTAPATLVNVEDYFFVSDPRVKGKYVNGSQGVWADSDPDGYNRKTYVLAKFTGSRNYEVYQLSKETIDEVYEVSRGNKDTARWNFRRYFNEPETRDYPGQSVLWRTMTPGGQGLLTTHNQKRYVFIPDGAGGTQGHYEFTLGDPNNPKSIKKKGKGKKPRKPETVYESVNFAEIHFRKGDDAKLGITQVLRLNSEWKDDGSAFENYEYAKGIGLVNWRFCENLASLLSRPAPDIGTNVYEGGKAINNKIYMDVEPAPDLQQPPAVYFIDPKTHQRADQAEVFKFQTYWLRDSPPQWYVVERDRSREDAVTLEDKPFTPDFSLPEAGPGKSINCWQNDCQ